MEQQVMANPNLREAPLTFRSSLKEGQDELQHDTLKLLPYARALRDFIQECETPMTIGVQGDWGIGKTSLMNMLRGTEGVADSGLLNQECCKVISFETWLYSQFNQGESLAITCMHALTSKVSEVLKQSGSLDVQAIDSLESSAKTSLESVLANIRDGHSDNSEKDGFEDISAKMIGFRREFKSLLYLWKALDESHRFVIFIDDLDRIPPLAALQILEAIKNFIEVPGCVFVLAVDYEVVQQGMADKLGRSIQKTSGKAFYDKMIQLPFIMPSSSYHLDDYIAGLLKRSGSLFSENFSDAEGNREYFLNITMCTVGCNPRNIKRAMNYADLLERIRRQEGGESGPREVKILYALICMHIAWPELFVHFAKEPTVDTVTSLENWDYLDKLPDARALIDRMPDTEKFKNDVSTFFDTLFSVLDENGDGQIDSRELEPVLEVMLLARMTAVEGHQRPRDFFVERVRENNKGGSALVDTFLENVFMKSVWYLGSECRYRKSGGRFVTIIHEGRQIGSLVSLKNKPFVFRLAMSPEKVSQGLKDYWKSKHSVKKEVITLARSMFDKEASLTGFGDTVIDFSKMTNMPAKDAIGMMNALFRIVTEKRQDRSISD
jgi:hypothetical protein